MALDFNGSSDYLHYTGSGVTVSSYSPMVGTLMCWIKDDVGSGTAVVSQKDDAILQDTFGLAFVSYDNFTHHLEGNADTGSRFTPATSTWECVAGVYRGNADRDTWLDGTLVGTTTTSRTITTEPVEFVLGAQARATITDYYTGKIAEVALWDVALTSAELAALAAGVSPLLIRPGELLRYISGVKGTGQIDLITGDTPAAGTVTEVDDHPRIIRPSAQILQFPPPAAGGSTGSGLTNSQLLTRRSLVG